MKTLLSIVILTSTFSLIQPLTASAPRRETAAACSLSDMSYEKKYALLTKTIELAHKQIAANPNISAINAGSSNDYNDESLGFAWCDCENAPKALREETIKYLALWYDHMHGKDKDSKTLYHVEFGAGKLLHLFLFRRCLEALGFMDVNLIAIDNAYGPRKGVPSLMALKAKYGWLCLETDACPLVLLSSVSQLEERLGRDKVTSCSTVDLIPGPALAETGDKQLLYPVTEGGIPYFKTGILPTDDTMQEIILGATLARIARLSSSKSVHIVCGGDTRTSPAAIKTMIIGTSISFQQASHAKSSMVAAQRVPFVATSPSQLFEIF